MSIKSRIKEMNNLFSVFDDSMDKYSLIIEFGKKQSTLSEKDKNSKNKIRGLLNILEFVISNSTKNEIFKLNIENLLNEVGLEESISSQRTNGFMNALNKIKIQINECE